MSICPKCKRSSVFLHLDKESGLCPTCEESRIVLEDKAISLLSEIKTLAEEINISISLSLFFSKYDLILSLLRQASDIEAQVPMFKIINGNFRRDYENNAAREQAAIRDVLRRICRHIHYMSKTQKANDADVRYLLKNFKNEIDTYWDRFDSENRKAAEQWFDKLCEVCGFPAFDNDPLSIDSLNGYEFERWCAALLSRIGFSGVRITAGSGDQGVDIVAEKDEIRYAIQCKCYSSNLGNSPIQEVCAGKTMYGCQIGLVMTNSYFTKPAKELAKATGTLLWDRDRLIKISSGLQT